MACIRGLDLSKNLLPTWDVVASIATELRDLRSLSLNQNRLRPPQLLRPGTTAFQRLEDLQLNGTLTTWDEFRTILIYLPSLRTIELGYNRLRNLVTEQDPQGSPRGGTNATLHSVNLDSNNLVSFGDICAAMGSLLGIRRLVLTSNYIASISSAVSPPEGQAGEDSPVGGLTHLALAFNRLADWHDIDTLTRWCPQLESLTLAGNPLVEDPTHKPHARSFTIAKVPSLRVLDGATVTPKERTDSELLYLSYISKQPLSDDAKRAAHPQWQALCAKHGVSDAPTSSATQEMPDTLSNRLINVRIYHATSAPPRSLPSAEVEDYLRGCRTNVSLRVLSTMTVRTFRLKALKTFKIPKTQQNAAKLWMLLRDGQFVEMDEEYAGRDLSWWGVEENTLCVISTSEQ